VQARYSTDDGLIAKCAALVHALTVYLCIIMDDCFRGAFVVRIRFSFQKLLLHRSIQMPATVRR